MSKKTGSDSNGGLFDSDEALPLTRNDIDIVLRAARMNWSDIDPSILGTLFERGLDPDKRSQLGAHYTDHDKIMMIVEPVVLRPLEREWQETRRKVEAAITKAEKSKGGAKTKALKAAERHRQQFMERLRNFRVLDPACGSGNFLYLSLLSLKDLEHRINLDCEAMGLQRQFPSIGPEAVKGIEMNLYAAELARVTVWIGEIQWMKRNGFNVSRNPVLKPLEIIECRDALLNSDGTETEWPKVNVIVGNPPFLGNKRMKRILGTDYVMSLRNRYSGRVSGGADLVIYWFLRSWELLNTAKIERAGLVGTQAIRRGASRKTLDEIVKHGRIFDAWDDEEWTVDGADVRVSLVCFDTQTTGIVRLDGLPVPVISSDLNPAGDLTHPNTLGENTGVCFQGTIKGGPFEVSGELAREWLQLPANPNGHTNTVVLFPWANADEITGRTSDKWIIDFGVEMSEKDAALFEAPYQHLRHEWEKENERRNHEDEPQLREGEQRTLERWWLHQRPRPRMRKAIAGMDRYIATPRVSKHRLFVWLDQRIMPDTRLVVFARADDTVFGIFEVVPHRWTGWRPS